MTKQISANRCFGGRQLVIEHTSAALDCAMRFAVYVPPQAAKGPVPVLWWLSGLTCTEENFITKAGAQMHAADHGLIIVAPDTSPRGVNLPGEDDDYDFGSGAGFYLDATEEPWSAHYRMYRYITRELPDIIFSQFPGDPERQGIFGHSMGGHGALTIALKNPGTYKSLSAFAPIVAPTQVPWGEKAFSGYLGSNRETWRQYDATELIKNGDRFDGEIFIDQGGDDPFLGEQLKPELFEEACGDAGQDVLVRMQPGYDHSYYFIATFMGEHIAHHARALR